jgi:predicted glutamine amidotransferase
LLDDPPRSLIEQSRRHAPDMAIANGDGTGLGWYEHRPEPALPGCGRERPDTAAIIGVPVREQTFQPINP